MGCSEAPPRRREVELLACCIAAVSRRSRSSPRTHRPSVVEGSGIAQTSIAAAATFWLARLKIGGCSLPSSLLMRRWTSRALHRALPPSLRPRCSCSRVSRSYYSWSRSWSTFAWSSQSCSRSRRQRSSGATFTFCATRGSTSGGVASPAPWRSEERLPAPSFSLLAPGILSLMWKHSQVGS